jgi:hypothetical protein
VQQTAQQPSAAASGASAASATSNPAATAASSSSSSSGAPLERHRSRTESGSGWSDSDDNKDEVTKNRKRNDSFFDTEDEEDDSEPEQRQVPSRKENISQPSKTPTPPIMNNGRINNGVLEAQVDEEVLRWAYGKNISRLLQTVGEMILENVPSLGPTWAPHMNPPQDPVSVRKAFL